MTREVLQMALDALEGVLDDDKDVLKASISGGLYEVVDCQRAIKALRAELAKPEAVSKYSDVVSDGGLDPRNVHPEPVQQKCNMHTEYLR